MGNISSISTVPFPKYESKYLVENEINYPVSFNGKMFKVIYRLKWVKMK